MRVNKFVASALAIGRRQADKLIGNGEVLINGQPANTGDLVGPEDTVTLNGKKLTATDSHTTLVFHKPTGYVCSRNGQGSKTIYELLPEPYLHLNPAGRLDKNTSGLLIMTSDGQLIERLTHPRYEKPKLYEVHLNQPVSPAHQAKLIRGIKLEDGLSTFDSVEGKGIALTVSLHEGRNRQVRRTFAALGYSVIGLHRTHFGPYELGNLPAGDFKPAE